MHCLRTCAQPYIAPFPCIQQFDKNMTSSLSRQELEAGFYVRQQWHDNRLAGLNDTVSLYGEAFKTIWRPDLFLRDATLKVLDNGIDVYHVTRVNTTGSVWHAIRQVR